MTKEEALAMDLALEALVYASSYCDTYDAITAIKQARALDKKAENARELGLDYEPVACVQDLDEVKRKHLVYEKGMDWKDPLYTTPPAAQRQWVGLTAGERDALFTKHYQWDDYGKAIEAKLKEKNNG